MTTMQLSMLIGSAGTLSFILVVAKKNRMNVHYTIVWVIWALLMILLSIFPGIIDGIARLLSISIPVNALFLILIFALYLITFYLFLRMAKQDEKIKTLTYQIAEMRKQADEQK